MAMNREQRRAQLKALGSRFKGFDMTSGVLEVPIRGKEETLKIDMMDYNVIYNLVELSEKFSNIEEAYEEEFTHIDSIKEDMKKATALFKIYKVIIDDFVDYVDKTFGDGSAKLIFGGRAPMPQLIMEFLEDLTPIIQTAISIMNSEVETMTTSKVSKYSASREGNV